MKTFRTITLCLLLGVAAGCATTGTEKTGTIQLPPVEYVR